MKKNKWIYFSLGSAIFSLVVVTLIATQRDAGSAPRPNFEPATEVLNRNSSIANESGAIPSLSASPAAQQLISGRDYRQLEQRLADMRARRRDQSFDPHAVERALAQKNVWRPLDTVPASLPLKPKERNDGRQFVRFDPLKMESLMPGDELTLTVSRHGTPYRARIDSVEIHDNGRITWNGRLLNQRDDYSLTFTRGEFLTVGGINTPEGHYTLQSHGDLGWVASSKTLAKHAPHVDPIVPPQR